MTMIRKLKTKPFVVAGVLLASILCAAMVVGCTGGNGIGAGRDSEGATASQGNSVRGAGGEHAVVGEAGEGVGEHGGGGEGGGGGSGSEEGSGANLAPDETFDMVRGGARLILNYDAGGNSFRGTVENTTNSVLTRVRIEVHLSNGTELGPTTPVDLAPGQVMAVDLPSTQASFSGWIAHAEVDGGAEGGQSGGEVAGEHGGGGEGSGGESGGEGGGTGAEVGEAAMSSPVIPLDQTWDGVLGGLAVSARYDAATRAVQAVVRNTLSQTLCYVQAEPHLKSGTGTVGELGPDRLGDLSAGQVATSSLAVADEPTLAGVSYDGYVVHLEVFDCGGPGPMPHAGGEGAGGGAGEGAGGEGTGSEGSGEGPIGGEEGGGANLALEETFDVVHGGARLILSYDAGSNSFSGTVENTTKSVLARVRIERAAVVADSLCVERSAGELW